MKLVSREVGLRAPESQMLCLLSTEAPRKGGPISQAGAFWKWAEATWSPRLFLPGLLLGLLFGESSKDGEEEMLLMQNKSSPAELAGTRLHSMWACRGSLLGGLHWQRRTPVRVGQASPAASRRDLLFQGLQTCHKPTHTSLSIYFFLLQFSMCLLLCIKGPLSFY